MNKFIINTRDFCCKTLALRDKLVNSGHKIVYTAVDRKNPGHYVWFFEMSDDMVKIISEYLNKEVIWTF